MAEIDIVEIAISAIIMAIIGFITVRIWGLDIPKFYFDLSALLTLALPLTFFDFTGCSIEEISQFLEIYLITLFNVIFGGLVGDSIGSVVSLIIKDTEGFIRNF